MTSNNNNNTTSTNKYILFYQDDSNFLLKRKKILEDKFQYPTFVKGVFHSILTHLCEGCDIRRETMTISVISVIHRLCVIRRLV